MECPLRVRLQLTVSEWTAAPTAVYYNIDSNAPFKALGSQNAYVNVTLGHQGVRRGRVWPAARASGRGRVDSWQRVRLVSGTGFARSVWQGMVML